MHENKLDELGHSLAHLLAAAVLNLYPNTKITLGPAVENGFYYDFDFESPISEKDLPKIEKEMRKILPSWKEFVHKEVKPKEAQEFFKDNPYKLELIEEISSKGEKITFYTAGKFTDLCRGGHVKNPSKDIAADAFKLDKIAGAYWRGNEKNKMLTRIYGLAFKTKKNLEKYEKQRQDAEKRDHRKLGRELDLFTFSELIGSGLPLFTPKGTILRDALDSFSQNLRLEQNFQKVWVPHLTKKELYEKSGHWDKFGEELFLVKSQETKDELVIKPMNCPHHQQIYASRPRSYRDLPIRYIETTTVYRDEKAGELLGLSRVRSITQDDSHIFCTPEQIKEEFQTLVKIVKKCYDKLEMKFRARLSLHDPLQKEKYLGEETLWKKAEDILLEVAKDNDLDYYIATGEAAFYGPKIDFMITDAIGREWQLATPQLDFVQPKRFGLKYINKNGEEQTPVMIHFALLGSLERFLSVYIEHTAGAFPFWLSPVQVKILPIGESHREYGEKILKYLKENNTRAELDKSDETLGKKIRNVKLEKVPYWIVLGDKELKGEKIKLESRDKGDLGTISLKKSLEIFKKEL
jgi:threonyl-tRNA synthetase